MLNVSTWSSLWHLRQPLHHDPSAFCRVILGGKCAQAAIERDRFGLAEDTVPFDIRKFREFKLELFGQMERAPSYRRNGARVVYIWIMECLLTFVGQLTVSLVLKCTGRMRSASWQTLRQVVVYIWVMKSSLTHACGRWCSFTWRSAHAQYEKKRDFNIKQNELSW